MKNFKLFIGIAAMAAALTVSCGPKPIEVISIELDITTLTLKTGESQLLTATVLPDDATDKSVTWTSSDAAVASVEDGTITANAAGTATIIATAGNQKATCTVTVQGVSEINGVRWATCNTGAAGTFVSNPEDYGNHYNFDAAKNACPAGWRVPTFAELSSLFEITKVARAKEVLNNKNGMRFTDIISSNSIFLPAAGYRVGSNVNDAGYSGDYWSSETYELDNTLAYSYSFFYDDGYSGSDTAPKTNGFTVRCVAE